MLHRELLINGVFVGGPCDQAVGKLVIRAPYDGAVVGTAAEGGWSEVNTAIASAHDAFPKWSQSSRSQRRELLLAIAEKVGERADELANILTQEVGKPITWSKGEVSRLRLTFELAADLCESYGYESVNLSYDARGKDYESVVERFPIGPILGIVPYNWPLNLAAHKIAPALATGNTIVIKASSLAPLSPLTLARLIHEAGCPDGVVNAVACTSALAQKMALDPRIKKVTFTGSPAVGWMLKEKLPRKKVTLELGGDASAIVCEDANLEWATDRIVSGKFGYAGQICISVQHVRAQASVYEEVKALLIAKTRSCPTGDPMNPQTVCGPLIHEEAARRVMEWVDEAVAGGAQVLVGGERQGTLVQPTLIEGVPVNSRLGCAEVFGPVLTLSKFELFDEVLSTVNASPYGIHCGVFTKDEARRRRAFVELEVGGVVIDDYPTLRFDSLPYGGVKESGFGREGVRYAMDEMTEPKSLVIRRG